MALLVGLYISLLRCAMVEQPKEEALGRFELLSGLLGWWWWLLVEHGAHAPAAAKRWEKR